MKFVLSYISNSEMNGHMLLTLLAYAGSFQQPYICPCPSHEHRWGRGGGCKDVVPLIHNLNGGEWSPSRHSHFTPGKGTLPPSPTVPRAKNRSGLLGEEKTLLSLPGIEHRIVHPFTSSLCCLGRPEVSVVLSFDAVSLENLWATIRQ